MANITTGRLPGYIIFLTLLIGSLEIVWASFWKNTSNGNYRSN